MDHTRTHLSTKLEHSGSGSKTAEVSEVSQNTILMHTRLGGRATDHIKTGRNRAKVTENKSTGLELAQAADKQIRTSSRDLSDRNQSTEGTAH